MTKAELLKKAKAEGHKVSAKMTVVQIRSAMAADGETSVPSEPSLDELPAIFSRPRRAKRLPGQYGGPNPGAYVRNAQGG